MRKYKDDLLKEFQVDMSVMPKDVTAIFEKIFNMELDPNNESLQLMVISNRIKDEMKKEMPDPWYCYGLGGIPQNETVAQILD